MGKSRSAVLVLLVVLMTFVLVGCPWLPGNASDDQSSGDETDLDDGSPGTDDPVDDPVDGPVTCEYPSVPATDPEANSVLNGVTVRHNYWRALVGVPALQWNTTLAAEAQAYAETLQFAHDPDRSDTGSGFSYVGENIYWSSGTGISATAAVDAWASERSAYDYGMTIGTGTLSDYGHYTQVVWDGTTDLGCGYAVGDVSGPGNGIIVVCRYGPGGNYSGQTAYDFTDDPCVDLDNDDTVQQDDADDTDRTVQ